MALGVTYLDIWYMIDKKLYKMWRDWCRVSDELAGKAHDSRETVRLSSATWENLNTWFSHINKSFISQFNVA